MVEKSCRFYILLKRQEMLMNKKIVRIILWTVSVLTLSFICYLPMLLERYGIGVSPILTAAKYLFVIVPLMISVIFSAAHGELKRWLAVLFDEKIKTQEITICAVTGAAGLMLSFVYSLIANERDLFTNNYPTFSSVIVGSAYLFVTALAEESAWRGYLLNQLSDSKETPLALIYTSMVWAVWHIPMWTIRNSLGIGETALYFIWTLLLSFVLGKFFLTYKNITTAALLHMLFNICFIAPVYYNIVVLSLAAAAVFIVTVKKKHYI